MIVRFTQSFGTAKKQHKAGDVVEVDDAEARRLIEAGQAVDPAGSVTRAKLSRGKVAGKENLDRSTSEPMQKLPSSLGHPGHPDATPTPAAEAEGSGGIAATNAPADRGESAAPKGSTPEAVKAAEDDAAKAKSKSKK